MHGAALIEGIGLSIIAATGLGIAAKALKQPLLLAYIAAGILLGPRLGLGLIEDEASIQTISEIGLILLLFIIGLEIDVKKLLSSGSSLIAAGVSQFALCVLMGLALFPLLGFALGGGKFDALYMAVGLALSSTMIVVKLLYDKFELGALPGRITLGILVFQDIWAILFLAVQPNLHDPGLGVILLSFLKGGLLVVAALAASRHLLGRLFAFIAKMPELVLVTAVAWCFLVSEAAGAVGLSREMGALIAGVSLSTFPYNIDVIAKVVNIRDFFVTLFFVGLGLQIPMPSVGMLALAVVATVFLALSRFVSIFPVLYLLKNGMRTSLLPPINLSQMSEFSLVIASIGLGLGHVQAETVGVLTFVFAIAAVGSTYAINANHLLQQRLAVRLRRLGLKDLDERDETQDDGGKDVIFLGFYREASSLFHELEQMDIANAAADTEGAGILRRSLVIDFNPQVHAELKRRGLACMYGDIASLDTLHHAHMGHAAVIVATIPDTILRGVTNMRLLAAARRVAPHARVIVTTNTLAKATALYEAGADFVFIPRIHSVRELALAIAEALHDSGADGVAGQLALRREAEQESLATRREVLG
ncbi:cation:proton antiporter domain-containing protein [Megalodesulfovibrio paquesii]